MAKKSDKIKVRGYERTGQDGNMISVSGYERLKGGRPQEPLLQATTLAPVEGTKIITRDPDRHGKAQPLQGVKIFGKHGGQGVERVSR